MPSRPPADTIAVPPLRERLSRLGLGLLLLFAFLSLLLAGPLPPGAPGEVIRVARDQDIQATALFYMDLERMPELEARLEAMKRSQAPR